MRDLERKIEKLEQREGSNREEIYELLNVENLHVLEKTRILYNAGLITGKMIAGWIKDGTKENNNGK